MAGHSKWANIQYRKKAQDARRGKLFTKLIREITVNARAGGGDPAGNPRLRLAVDKAIAANMSKDNIDRAIKRGTGELEGVTYENISYEGYGIGGTAVLVECMTDNRNRTVAEVRHIFGKYGGKLGTSGSVAYLFEQRGVLNYAPGCDEDAIIEAALEAGADDVETDEDSTRILTSPQSLPEAREAMLAAGLAPETAEVGMYPLNLVELGRDDADTLMRMLTALEDCDDVQNVYCNADFPGGIPAADA